jgi:hypothetical protein
MRAFRNLEVNVQHEVRYIEDAAAGKKLPSCAPAAALAVQRTIAPLTNPEADFDAIVATVAA